MRCKGDMAYGHKNVQHTQQHMAEYIMFEDCGRNHSNKHIEVEAYSAVQDELEDKLVDVNIDKENKI
eukprot:13904291-Heterocapsa_arctica.AAC.1